MTSNKSFFLLCGFFFILCLMLGSWQVKRFYFKKDLLNRYENKIHQLPRPFALLFNEKNVEFEPVAVRGHYITDLTVLLQNRMHNGRLGFEVLTPLKIAGSKKLLLIDRGWVAKPPDSPFPVIHNISEVQNLTGYLKLNQEYQFTLGANVLSPTQRPIIMQKIDVTEIKALTRLDFYPFIVRLDPTMPNGFLREWVVSSAPPSRHLGYAVQWFALALVIIIAYLFFSYTKEKTS